MSTSLSPEVSGLLDRLSDLSSGLRNGEPGAREGLMGACRAMFYELAHPMEAVLMLYWGQPTHHTAIRLGLDLKLFETLAAEKGVPKSVAQLAAPCHADPLLVSRMMKHLAAMNTVRELDVDTYGPTPLSNTLNDPHVQDTVRFLQDDYLPVHGRVPEYFKQRNYKNPDDGTDSPFQYTFNCKGEGFFDYFVRAPEMGRRFGSMMTAWSVGRPRWMNEGYYPVQERLVQGSKQDDDAVFLVDVAGGRGHDLEGLKEAHPTIKGKLILQDRPEVISLAQLSPGLEKLAHDFNTPQPIKGARAYFLHSIMQDWSDDECIHILKQLVPALTKNYSKVLLNEFILPNKGAHWGLTALDWQLMACLSARQRTDAEFRALLAGAGLKVVAIFKHPQSLDNVIEAELA